MTLNINDLNQAPSTEASVMLSGIYEHSEWIAEQADALRPFKSIATLKLVMCGVISRASYEQKLALLRAHPELAGKAMINNALTAESKNEQSQSGLTHCSPQEFELIQKLPIPIS